MAQAGKDASPGGGVYRYERHRPETTLLYRLVAEYYRVFADQMSARGTPLPEYVQREFEDYLRCGRLEYGFLRVKCESCHAEHLVAFSCKRRGFCPSCGARRMAETAALLVDEILSRQPLRQWMLSVPYPLCFLFACRPDVMGRVLAIMHRAIATHLIHKAGFTRRTACTGAVTQVERFGSALNLNINFHVLFLDGVYTEGAGGSLRFHPVAAPTGEELSRLVHTLARQGGAPVALRKPAAALPPSRAPPQLEIGDDWLKVRPYLASLFATSGMVWWGRLCLGVR
mgnify:CR=1 FL=1